MAKAASTLWAVRPPCHQDLCFPIMRKLPFMSPAFARPKAGERCGGRVPSPNQATPPSSMCEAPAPLWLRQGSFWDPGGAQLPCLQQDLGGAKLHHEAKPHHPDRSARLDASASRAANTSCASRAYQILHVGCSSSTLAGGQMASPLGSANGVARRLWTVGWHTSEDFTDAWSSTPWERDQPLASLGPQAHPWPEARLRKVYKGREKQSQATFFFLARRPFLRTNLFTPDERSGLNHRFNDERRRQAPHGSRA